MPQFIQSVKATFCGSTQVNIYIYIYSYSIWQVIGDLANYGVHYMSLHNHNHKIVTFIEQIARQFYGCVLENWGNIQELYMKSFKEGQNLGFEPSLRNFSMKSSLACCVYFLFFAKKIKFWICFDLRKLGWLCGKVKASIVDQVYLTAH